VIQVEIGRVLNHRQVVENIRMLNHFARNLTTLILKLLSHATDRAGGIGAVIMLVLLLNHQTARTAKLGLLVTVIHHFKYPIVYPKTISLNYAALRNKSLVQPTMI
jgi:hypothetical protein